MSTTTTDRPKGIPSEHERGCTGCGAPADTRNQLREQGHRDEALCLICERAYLTGDLGRANAAVEIVEAAVEAALNGNANPEDIAAAVAGAIHRMTTVPAARISDVAWALEKNRARLDDVGSVISRGEAI